jgi:hypothetical protein
MTSPVVYRQAPRANSTCLRSNVQKGDGRWLSSTTEEKYTITVSARNAEWKVAYCVNTVICVDQEENRNTVIVVAILVCESEFTVAVVSV